jgi:DNA gyrase/topoisomerase IV subunit A
LAFQPHSDLALYETIIGLAQHFNKLNVFIEPQGNVGSIDDFDSFAAQRYVELRMSSFTNDLLFQDMNKSFIPMKAKRH